MNRLKFNVMAVALLIITAVQVGFVSCSDDPGADSYYTMTKEYASDYLQNRDQFSDFVQILGRATGEKESLRLIDMLGTWGTYTVFAPTNDAIQIYLTGRGLSSIDELTKEDCDTIALNSIIDQAYYTSDGTSDGLKANMLDRNLSLICDSVVNDMGNIKIVFYVNDKQTPIIHADDSVGNGVVHTMGRVVLSNNAILSDFLRGEEADGGGSKHSIYYQALTATHMSDSLTQYRDESYSVGSDSIDWTNDRLVLPTATEYDNVAYMEKRFIKYTMFVCPDSVLAEKYSITDLDGLRAKAHELYDPVFPEDANIADETDRRNALNRFISYHILDRYGSYYSLTCVDGPTNSSTLAKNWNRRKIDIADWYETMMPHSILKCSYPSGTQEGLYINRRGVQSRADERGVFVRGAKVTPPDNMGVSNICPNGIFHYIDDIIEYDAQTQNVVLNERLRIDATTLSPDFMTSGARGHYTRSSYENGKYGTWDNTSNKNNKQTCLGFKPGSAKNFSFTNDTHVHVRPRTLSFWSYQGDEVTVLGIFDLTVKIPPVPVGTYELRLFTCVNFSNRGIVQVYIDGIPQGIPFDMRPSGTQLFGWKSDEALGDEDAIGAYDKSIHNIGWMKGPKSYYSATNESGGTQGQCFRDADNTLRRVLGTFVSDGKTDHYVRFKQVLETATPGNSALNFDFIELVPSSVYNNEYFAEDRW